MKENVPSLLGSDSVAAHQYFDTFRRSEHLESEQALLLAILEDAIHCLRKYRAAKDRLGRERFQEAEAWLMRQGNDWIFSFDNVCELLGLDPEYIRRGVQEWSAPAVAQERRRGLTGSRTQAA